VVPVATIFKEPPPVSLQGPGLALSIVRTGAGSLVVAGVTGPQAFQIVCPRFSVLYMMGVSCEKSEITSAAAMVTVVPL
jgi:hypothetical protein